jgi:acyl-CoA-dependent ceramide synthase
LLAHALRCYETTSGIFVSADAGTSVFANILQPFNERAGFVCFNPQIRWSFLGLLLALQSLLLSSA